MRWHHGCVATAFVRAVRQDFFDIELESRTAFGQLRQAGDGTDHVDVPHFRFRRQRIGHADFGAPLCPTKSCRCASANGQQCGQRQNDGGAALSNHPSAQQQCQADGGDVKSGKFGKHGLHLQCAYADEKTENEEPHSYTYLSLSDAARRIGVGHFIAAL